MDLACLCSFLLLALHIYFLVNLFVFIVLTHNMLFVFCRFDFKAWRFRVDFNFFLVVSVLFFVTPDEDADRLQPAKRSLILFIYHDDKCPR